ncbi:tetratricopeptide repeat protein [Flectobacillus major]|uniref:tetratricopeptide repeat protein n=1 Tax=Flectobacillus major TaxID=103 RepID=UPI00041949D5|nr:tetratricopeptide repeat protein [Flectobacillus major]
MKKLPSIVFLSLAASCSISNSQLYAQSTLNYSEVNIHFRNGQEYFESKSYEAARAEFQLYLSSDRNFLDKNDPNTAWAQYYIIMCSLYMNRAETELLADRFVREHPEHTVSSTLFREIGNYFFDNGDYARAIDYLSKSSKSDEAAQYRLGIAHFTLQNYSNALSIFNRLKESSNPEFGPSAAYYAGVIQFRAKHYEEAIPDFKRAEQSSMYRSEMPSWIANAYYRQGKLTEMLAYTEPILREKNSGRKLEDVALLTAEVYFQQGNFEKASYYYGVYKNYKSQGMLPAVAYRYGYSLYKTNQFVPATEQLRNVAAVKDTLGQYSAFVLGICYQKSNNLNYALGAFDQASKLTFNKTVKEEATFNYAKVLLDLGRGGESVKAFETFLAQYPGSRLEDEANELISEAYLASNNYLAALAYIEGLKKRTTRTNLAYQRIAYNQGVKRYNEEAYLESITFFDKSLRMPENPELRYSATFWKAEALSAEKRFQEAVNYYQSLINTNDVRTVNLAELQQKSRYSVAYAYYNLKDYDKANIYFKEFTDRQATKDSQTYQDAIVRLADTYYAKRNYEQALKYYDLAYRSNKSDRDYALYQKGMIQILLKDEAGGKKTLDDVTKQFPESIYLDKSLFQTAENELQNQRYSQAISAYSRLIMERPKSSLVPLALIKRASAFVSLNKLENAVLDYKYILKYYPTEPESKDALNGLQEALTTLDRPEEFGVILADYQKANPLDTSVISREYELAKNLFYKDAFDKAIPALKEYVRKYPNANDVYEANYLIAEAYIKLNNKQEALRYYYIVIAENKFKNVNKAVAKAAQIEFEGTNYVRAITNYKTLLSLAIDKKDVQTSLIGLMESYYNTPKSDSTLYFARQIINNGDVILGAKSKANLYIGRIYMQQGDLVRATEAFNQTIAIAKDDLGGEAQIMLAKMLYNEKKYKESSDMIMNKFRTDFAAVSDPVIGKAYLLLADNFIAMDNIVQARTTLNSIINNLPDEQSVEQARLKLRSIERR